LLNWLINGPFFKQIKQQHELLGKKQSILDQYAAILSHFSKANADNSVQLQKEKAIALEAHQSVKKLSRLSAMFDQRLNLAISFLANSFFLFDIQCLWALEKWKQQHKDRFHEWSRCVGSIEALNSMATFAFNYPEYRYPTVNTDTISISATQMAHPLIPAKESVANDATFGMNEQLVLVTGSNMSGKTTFLRTLGVNLILAQCGAPVCAATFIFTPMVIRSSIRVSDSLQEHTSYFMAELKRLQQIIHYLQQQTAPVLILIDEILRGTNSEDKTHGSEQFIKKLLQYRCLTLFATHDLTLSRLEDDLPGKVNNYCFESTISNGELLFDYKLQRGVAKNKNASFLMKKMEII
jgi:DNA mismatch repair ATPase MutS